MHTYRKGYFSYVDDGFGEVATDVKELIEILNSYLLNSCQPPPKYLLRMKNCFPFRDGKNSERVFNEIRKL